MSVLAPAAPLSVTAPVQLTQQDRCDRCGAQAYVRATFEIGELLFCGHHGRRFEDQLIMQADELQDERDRLEREHGPNSGRLKGSEN